MRLQLQKERLTAFVVHDLKNPVNSIDLHAQLLCATRELPERDPRVGAGDSERGAVAPAADPEPARHQQERGRAARSAAEQRRARRARRRQVLDGSSSSSAQNAGAR